GEVESDGVVHQRRLAVRTVPEDEGPGIHAQVTAQEGSQEPPAGDEAVAELRRSAARGALQFVRGEAAVERLDLGGRRVERSAPHLDPLEGKRGMLRRLAPPHGPILRGWCRPGT